MTWVRRIRRGSAALEAALILSAVLVLFGAVAQVLISAQGRIYLEQAAYAAARSALAHMRPPREILLVRMTGSALPRPGTCLTDPGPRNRAAQAKAEDAARWALIAAAPTTGQAAARGCDRVLAGEQIVTNGDSIAGRDQAAINAMCYVFEQGNVTVDLAWQPDYQALAAGATAWPIRATVTFRMPLSTPFRRFVRDGERGDGTYWKMSTASVTLL